jgi:signal transduction histidine kinase
MSHELRTPMNAILGFNEMILDDIYGEVPAHLREPLADIQTNGKHLLRLINDVLDLSKIEAGRMELALAEYSVQDVVDTVGTSLQSLAAEKGIDFIVGAQPNIPLAYGDGMRITQCLLNLTGNALKFTKEGKVEVWVERQGESLHYRVSDTGIGIPQDRLELIFGEFQQADATVAQEFGGSGLGLSITKKFVELHGGRIRAESQLGKGSVISFEIPLRVGQGSVT